MHEAGMLALDSPANFFVSSNSRIQFSFFRHFGQIYALGKVYQTEYMSVKINVTYILLQRVSFDETRLSRADIGLNLLIVVESGRRTQQESDRRAFL